MSEQIQELINKIKDEGFQAAQTKAQEIETQAQAKADALIEKASANANKMIDDAKAAIDKMQAASKNALEQASRDVLLNLRKEINVVLKSLVMRDVKKAMSEDVLSACILAAVKGFFDQQQTSDGIVAVLSSQQLAALKDGFMKKLQDQIKQGLTFESSEDIDQGFMISFDKGSSSFDFTDASLADQLCLYLNAEISALVKTKKTSK